MDHRSRDAVVLDVACEDGVDCLSTRRWSFSVALAIREHGRGEEVRTHFWGYIVRNEQHHHITFVVIRVVRAAFVVSLEVRAPFVVEGFFG